MKLTEWYPGEVKPVRKGVYQQRDGGRGREIGYQFWNGKFWSTWCRTPKDAKRCIYKADESNQNDPWRGVAK